MRSHPDGWGYTARAIIVTLTVVAIHLRFLHAVMAGIALAGGPSLEFPGIICSQDGPKQAPSKRPAPHQGDHDDLCCLGCLDNHLSLPVVEIAVSISPNRCSPATIPLYTAYSFKAWALPVGARAPPLLG
jgi:hypothetical protein